MNHDELIAERNAEYDEAHLKTGQWMISNWDALRKFGSRVFDVCMVHNKLTRALGSPNKRDNFDDIIGYAKLALSIPESPPYFARQPDEQWQKADGSVVLARGEFAARVWKLMEDDKVTLVPTMVDDKIVEVSLVPRPIPVEPKGGKHG